MKKTTDNFQDDKNASAPTDVWPGGTLLGYPVKSAKDDDPLAEMCDIYLIPIRSVQPKYSREAED